MVKKKEIVKEIVKKEVPKIRLRSRIHYWLCDRLNVVSYDEFDTLCDDIQRSLMSLDRYGKAQNAFNKLIAERLNLVNKGKKYDFRGDVY